MASSETQQGCLSVDTGTSSQASLQGWAKPPDCSAASFSPRATRLSSARGKEQGQWAQWEITWLVLAMNPSPTQGWVQRG